jgi:hypothetical protein
MTILEASEVLFKWFAENDYFEMEEDFLQVNPITETKEKDKAALSLALEELERNDLVGSKETEGKTCWILKKPFAAYEQSVTITPPTALGLSQIVNSACESIGDDTDLCDPANIAEKDIRSLLLLYAHRDTINIDPNPSTGI